MNLFRQLQYRQTFKPYRAEPQNLEHLRHTVDSIDGPDGKIALRYKLLEGDSKFILFSHGNSSSIESVGPTYEFYESLGVSYLAYDYPGYGSSEGTPTEEGLYASFNCAFLYVTEQLKIQPEKLYLHGLSLGGAATIQALPNITVAGAILESTFTSAADMARVLFPFVPFIEFFARGFSSIELIPSARCDILFIHGEKDLIIPLEQTQRLAAATTAPNFTYTIPGGNHRDQKEAGGEEYRAIWQRFLANGVEGLNSKF